MALFNVLVSEESNQPVFIFSRDYLSFNVRKKQGKNKYILVQEGTKTHLIPCIGSLD